MKADERDDLMIRLDERSERSEEKIDKILEHQGKQNGWIITNTIYRRIIVGIGGTAVMALVLHLAGVY